MTLGTLGLPAAPANLCGLWFSLQWGLAANLPVAAGRYNCRRRKDGNSGMTPSQLAVDVQDADAEDVQEAIRLALTEAGLTLEELQAQAHSGRFSSEDARMAWWAVSPFVNDAG